MTRYDVDLFVIGGGSGGVRAARVAAEHGARVSIAEEYRWGGTCVIRGCVPKKLFVYASETSRQLEDARGFGWTTSGTFDWSTLIAAKDREIARLSAAYTSRLTKAGATLLEGRAHVVDPHTLEVGARRITAETILVATGGTPQLPGAGWITSNEAFHLATLPASIAIWGGGYIAVEFAHIFAGLGVATTLIHRAPLALRGFDPDVQAEVDRGLRAHGIAVIAGARAVERVDGAVIVDGVRVPCEVAMAALGRHPNLAGLGLAEAGVTLDARGAIAVDEWSRTSVASIYAVGDVTGRAALTPIAIREGHAFADTVYGKRPTRVVHELIPTAVFGQPPASTVGLTEPDARARHGEDVRIFRARFRPMRYSLGGRDEYVLIKLVVRPSDDRVLGLHMVGPDAPEIVQAAAIAITMGATKADLDRTFAMHPTTAEELVLLR